jgi:hypothetical protein
MTITSYSLTINPYLFARIVLERTQVEAVRDLLADIESLRILLHRSEIEVLVK